MSKMRVLLVGAAAATAFGAASFIPAMADPGDAPAAVETDGESYVVVTGGPDTIDGYIGVSAQDGGVVGCYEGEFEAGSANPITIPPGTPDPSDPCSPPTAP